MQGTGYIEHIDDKFSLSIFENDALLLGKRE